MPDPNIIEMACDRFTAEYKIAMSKDAKRLVALLVNAVETDPHPTWRRERPISPERNQFAAEARQITEHLPRILYASYQDAMIVDIGIENRKELTTFDLAHHLPRALRIAARLGGIRRLP